MRIKMLKTSANPKGTMSAGKVYSVNEDTARLLVSGGAAEYIEKPMEKAVKAPEPEKAIADNPEHIGGGWYKLPDGTKVRKKDLGADETGNF